MNYSKNTTYNRKVLKTKKKSYQVKLLVLMITSLLIGIIIGLVFTNIWFKASSKETEQEVQAYGKLEDKTFNYIATLDWSSGSDSEYIPLQIELDEDVQHFIYDLSYACNIDYSFVMGLIQTESNFKSDAISPTNDYGLMQINIKNHEWLTEKFGFNDYLDPYQNTSAGIYVLTKLFEKYEDPTKVLMAYNLGESGAKRLWENGIYETSCTNEVIQNITTINEEIERVKEND